MKTSFFTAMGLLALAGLGAAGPVAKENSHNKNNNKNNNDDIKHLSSNNNNNNNNEFGQAGSGHGSEAGSHSQQQVLYFCKNGQQGDIGDICQQCGGTPVTDQSCAPSTQGCKGVTSDCFTTQKCRKEYGQQAKVEQCGQHSPDSS